jgi:flagellar basal body rod protein FlgC
MARSGFPRVSDMSISAILATSIYGMQDSARRLGQAAQNIAVPSAVSVNEDKSTDFADDLLDVISAEHGFAANASVFETGADMWEVLMTIVKD